MPAHTNLSSASDSMCQRIVLLVMDSCGCGAAPDASKYGDEGSDTLGNLSRAVGGLHMPFFAKLGLGNLTDIQGVPPNQDTIGAYGRMREQSAGKDTTTGHWEMGGLVLDTPLPTFPQGFPKELISELEQKTGRRVIGNKTASGTTILDELGPHHIQTGDLIVYTSADSVLQIAAHEQIIPLEELYRIGHIARERCDRYLIGRVILRPFVGQPGAFQRTYNRRDFSMQPPSPTALDRLTKANVPVWGIGKIPDIFADQGIDKSIHTEGNADGMQKTLEALDGLSKGLIFCNLVDFDMLYGHRRDPQGYAQALQEMDAWLPRLYEKLGPNDWVFITADHGNDPTFHGTDHTREDVPILGFAKKHPLRPDLGIREGFYDVAQTLCDGFGLTAWPLGRSLLSAWK